jgi:hypothetical protein
MFSARPPLAESIVVPRPLGAQPRRSEWIWPDAGVLSLALTGGGSQDRLLWRADLGLLLSVWPTRLPADRRRFFIRKFSGNGLVMWERFGVVFTIPELRKKILFALGLLLVYRVGWWITVDSGVSLACFPWL